jgi:hypothetical protein
LNGHLFGTFSAIMMLNILHLPLACTLSPSMPMICRFGLLWNH